MKKILCLILCIILTCTTLVACSSETDIGGGIDDYPRENNDVEVLTLNMCIITDDSTTKSAADSVATRINEHVKRKYSTYLNVTFVKAGEYESYLETALAKNDGTAPHIVLINKDTLFESLYLANKLADLTDYYSSKDYQKDFGKLNTQINAALLQQSKVDGKLYTVPNNRVIEGDTGYTYLVINKEVAIQELKYGIRELEGYKSNEDASQLMADMANAGYNPEELVREVPGPYELRYELSDGNICNIIDVPTVTKEYAFSSAFAVIKNAEDKYNYRAMQIIYAINTDVELRNYLQYGVSGANYNVVDGDIVRIVDSENTYKMNIEYTGDVFKADFCSEYGWTQAAKDFGISQNADSKAE